MVTTPAVWAMTVNVIIWPAKGEFDFRARYPRKNVNFSTNETYTYFERSDPIRVTYESNDLNHLTAHLYTPRIVNRNPIDYATQYPAVRVEVECREPPTYELQWRKVVDRGCSPLGPYIGIGGTHTCAYGPINRARAVFYYGSTITATIPIPLALPTYEVDLPPGGDGEFSSEGTRDESYKIPWIIHPKRRMNAVLNHTILHRGFSRVRYNDDFRPWRRVAVFTIYKLRGLVRGTYGEWKSKVVTYGEMRDTNLTYRELKGFA